MRGLKFNIETEKLAKDLTEADFSKDQTLKESWQAVPFDVEGPISFGRYVIKEGYQGHLVLPKEEGASRKSGCGLVIHEPKGARFHSWETEPLASCGVINAPYTIGDFSILDFSMVRYEDPVHLGMQVNPLLRKRGIASLMRKTVASIDKALIDMGILDGTLRESDGSLTYETVRNVDLFLFFLSMGYYPVGFIKDYEERYQVDSESTLENSEEDLAHIHHTVRVFLESKEVESKFKEPLRLKKDNQKANTWRKHLNLE